MIKVWAVKCNCSQAPETLIGYHCISDFGCGEFE